MSLKSFDKFCENMIMGEHVQPQDIFDERQNQLRAKITGECLYTYAFLTFIALVIYEAGYAYCQSIIAVLAFCMAVCYLIWVIRNYVKGTLLGVKYEKTAFTASYILGLMMIYVIMIFNNNEEEITTVKSFFVAKGQLTEYFVLILACVIMAVSSVVVFSVMSKRKKSEKADNEKEAEE